MMLETVFTGIIVRNNACADGQGGGLQTLWLSSVVSFMLPIIVVYSETLLAMISNAVFSPTKPF